MSRYLPAAHSVAAVLSHVLKNELRLNPPARFVLTETPAGVAYLFAVMDETNIGKSITRYTNAALLHQLSTALKGRPVYLSNTTGLRYGVILSPKKELPRSSLYSGSQAEEINLGLLTPERAITLDPQEMQNILLTGDQGSGKSNILRLIAIAALEHGWDVYPVDPEENTFGGAFWDNISAMGQVASSQIDFINLLDRIFQLLSERKRLYQAVTVGMNSPNNIYEYNAKAETPLKRVIVIVDEANSYFDDPAMSKKVFELARRARKWGLNLVLAAHSWRGNDIDTSLRSMLKTRIAFHTEEKTSAEVVLGLNQHAKKVLKFQEPGRGIIRYKGVFSVFQSHLLPNDYEIGGRKPALLDSQANRLLTQALERPGEDAGKIDITFAIQTLGEPRRMVLPILERLETQKLIGKRADRNNARFVTEKAIELLNLEA